MEESRVRYSKLSMITATKRFSICGDHKGQRVMGRARSIQTHIHRGPERGGRLRKGNRKRKKWGDREEGHMLIQGAQAERWRNADGEERKTEIEKDGDRELEREGERSYKIEATPRGPL